MRQMTKTGRSNLSRMIAKKKKRRICDRARDPVDAVVLHPLEDHPAVDDRVDDHREAGRHQHNVRRRARRVGRAVHGDADVGLLERGRVVDAVARHADREAALLQHVDDRELVLGHHLREAVGVLDVLAVLREELPVA